MIEFIKKWLWCSWMHKHHHCYPEVWDKDSTYWHCAECDPCMPEYFEVD